MDKFVDKIQTVNCLEIIVQSEADLEPSIIGFMIMILTGKFFKFLAGLTCVELCSFYIDFLLSVRRI